MIKHLSIKIVVSCIRDQCESFSGYVERGEGEETGHSDCMNLVPDWVYIDDESSSGC